MVYVTKLGVINKISYSNVRVLVKDIVRRSDKQLFCTHKLSKKERVTVG